MACRRAAPGARLRSSIFGGDKRNNDKGKSDGEYRARCAAETANIDREGPHASSADALEASGPALESVDDVTQATGPVTPKSDDIDANSARAM